MKKANLINSFKSNRFKYGMHSITGIILMFTVILTVNLAAAKLNVKKDLSHNKLYSITKETVNILRSVKNNTKIYAFYKPGNEDAVIKTMLDLYDRESENISVQFIDPDTNPAMVQKYSKLDKKVDYGTVVVESGAKYKTINSYEFVNSSIDELGNAKIESFSAEQQLTNAVVYVNSDKDKNLFYLIGHEEKEISQELNNQLGVENYKIHELNLLQASSQLSQEDLLIINSPMIDISKEEANKLREFLSSGGRAAFFIDITKEVLPNFQSLLSDFDIRLDNHLVIEGDPEHVASEPVSLLPEIGSHEIVNAIKSNKLTLYIPVSQGIEIMEAKKENIKIEPLLLTTENSWEKIKLDNTFDKEPGDNAGPVVLAAAITEEDKNKEAKGKLVVVGSSSFMDSDINSLTNGTNIDFAMNCISWLQDKKVSIAIRPKNLAAVSFTMNEYERLTLSGIFVILIPGIVFASGTIVWFKRRHK